MTATTVNKRRRTSSLFAAPPPPPNKKIKDFPPEHLTRIASFLPSSSRAVFAIALSSACEWSYIEIRRLWEISPIEIVAACVQAFQVLPTVEERTEVVAFQCDLLRKSLPNADNALQQIVSLSNDSDFAYSLACYMADNGMLDFINWLSERMNNAGEAAVALQTIVFLNGTYKKAKRRRSTTEDGGSIKLVLSWQNLASMLRLLTLMDNETMYQVIPNTDITLGSEGKVIMEYCLQMYPNIATLHDSSYSNSIIAISPPNHLDKIEEGMGIEEAANAYFIQMYTSEESAREVVEMLKRFKTSESSRKNDIFACMIHNLFDEYRFFSKYPEKELRITGIVFGLLIGERRLLRSITLRLALQYVLVALSKPPNQSLQSGKMFRFGMFALEQFMDRLHEWPQYCSHIVQISHLRKRYAVLVNAIETAMEDNQTAGSVSTVPTDPTGASGVTERSACNKPDEIEVAVDAYFNQIYTSEENAREVVEMLKRFKASGSSRKHDIFACMIHNIFDEYRFFSKYPEKELRITGIVFGLLIKERIVSSITLGIALRYVLEALRQSPNQSLQSGKMFRFGMFALEQYMDRLHEWPQYCSHIVQISHLREEYAALVGVIETAMDPPPAPIAGASASVISSLPVYQLINPKEDLPEENRSCNICLEDFEGGDSRKCLPCLHGFHEKCIDQWLGLNGVCPICKTPVSD